jgi:hypothetical protein
LTVAFKARGARRELGQRRTVAAFRCGQVHIGGKQLGELAIGGCSSSY